jgi:RNA recognition motif-containing protein
MGKKLYVGNLSYNTTEDSLKERFEAFGHVESVRIITDRDTDSSKGFGFIEMGTDAEAQAAIASTNGQEVDGRMLKVNEAMDKPRDDRSRDNRRRGSYSY